MAETTWQRSPDVAVVDRGDRVVVLALADPTTAQPLVLEGPAAAIWRALEVARTARGLVEAVASDVGLPATDIETDVLAFLRELSGHGLVLNMPGPPVPRPRGRCS